MKSVSAFYILSKCSSVLLQEQSPPWGLWFKKNSSNKHTKETRSTTCSVCSTVLVRVISFLTNCWCWIWKKVFALKNVSRCLSRKKKRIFVDFCGCIHLYNIKCDVFKVKWFWRNPKVFRLDYFFLVIQWITLLIIKIAM